MVDQDYRSFWDETIKELRQELEAGEFELWFSNLGYVRASDKGITLSAPSVFFREQFKSRYAGRIEKKITELTGKNLLITLEVAPKDKEKPASPPQRAEKTVNNSFSTPVSVSRKPPEPAPPVIFPVKEKIPNDQLQEEYTFDTFIVSEDNNFAFNAARAVASNPGNTKNYNPLLIYGGTGLGKTHLMQAIGHYIYDNTNLKILYITGEGFMRDFVELTFQRKMNDFVKKYRQVDTLLIDDIHTLERGAGTQDELFYTFEALYNKKKQMIFTCDRPISELKNMAPRLQSRFQSGLHIDLKPPNYETRFAILKKKMENRSVTISDEILSLIAKHISSNVRDLQGALNKLMAYAELINKPITMELAQRELKDVLVSQKQGNLSIENIMRVVADHFHLSQADLKSKKRSKAIVRARHIAMYLSREITEYSFTEIGQFFGDRDHSTVLVSCEKIETESRTDTSLYSLLQELKRIIKESGIKSV